MANYVAGDLRDQLAHVGRSVVAAGLVVGSGGNLSARPPGADECVVTAAGTWLDRLDGSSFVRVRLRDGAVLDDDAGAVVRPTPADAGADAALPVEAARRPTSELALHLAAYRARPDVNAVVHLHPQTVLLLDALGERIRLVTTDHAYYLRAVVTTSFHPPGSAEVADQAAEAVAGGVDCVVLSRHGCSVVADSVELAHKRAVYLDEAARLTYRALALGRLGDLDEAPVAAWLAAAGTV